MTKDAALRDKMKAKIRRAKERAKSELSPDGWGEHGYAYCRSEWSGEDVEDGIQRIHQDEVSEAEFVERFERPGLPVLIQGCMDAKKTKEHWSCENMLRKYGDLRFKVGEDDDGYQVKMRLKYFFMYMEEQRDDCPLYIFDHFGDHPKKKALLKEFDVPKYFRDDLFGLVGEDRRPPYRWIVLGPERSGSGIHIDPLGTSAWNALLYGHKRWAIWPPRVPKTAVGPKPGIDRGGISWFMHVHPETKKSSWPSTVGPPIEFIQRPGETVFIPGGWHHTVLNLDDTVAVTQNFCSKSNFRLVWPRMARSRPKLSKKFLKEIEAKEPELFELSKSIDIHAPDELPPDSSSDSSSSSSSSSSEEGGREEARLGPRGERAKKRRKTASSLRA